MISKYTFKYETMKDLLVQCIFVLYRRCPRYSGLPDLCHLVPDPQNACCQVPYCDIPGMITSFQNQSHVTTPRPSGTTAKPAPGVSTTQAPSKRLNGLTCYMRQLFCLSKSVIVFVCFICLTKSLFFSLNNNFVLIPH